MREGRNEHCTLINMYIFIAFNRKKRRCGCVWALNESQIMSHDTQIVDLFNFRGKILACKNGINLIHEDLKAMLPPLLGMMMTVTVITLTIKMNAKNECINKHKSID